VHRRNYGDSAAFGSAGAELRAPVARIAIGRLAASTLVSMSTV